MHFQTGQDIILDFIDDRNQQQRKIERRLYIESLKDESKINFNDLLEKQWTFTTESQHFFHSKQQLPEQVIPELLSKDVSNLKGRDSRDKQRNNSKQTPSQPTMSNIFTIFDSSEYVEDIEMYLSSNAFSMFIRIVVIINFIGVFLEEYTFRLDRAEGNPVHMSASNAVSLHLETWTNCVFTIEIILYFFSSKEIFSSPWIILNIIGTIACWSTIFFDMFQKDQNLIFQILHIVRIIRAIRIIEVFESLKNLFEVFLGTVPSLSKIFFPLLVFMSFYAITGQQLFLGSNEYKCRVTPFPVDGKWQQVNVNLCGASAWQCPKDTYCGNLNDYGLPADSGESKRSNEYGVVGFDNFVQAMLTVYHYVFLSNWTGIIFKFSRYISPYLTTFYFVSMAVVLFYILANLIFISLSKAYIEKEKILQKKRENSFNSVDQENEEKQDEQQEPLKQSHQSLLKMIEIFEILLVILQCVFIVFDYKGMSQSLTDTLSMIDFLSTIVAIVVVGVRIAILRIRFLNKFHNMVDIVMILCFMADLVYCLNNRYSVMFIQTGVSAVLRGIKIIRIIKILYVSESLFKYERNIVNLFFQTLKNMRQFLLLLSCIVLIFSFIGQMLFAFRVRFDSQKNVDIAHGRPYVTNFEMAYKSIISTVLLFENERWTETMYNYYHARGYWAIFFFASVAFFVHLMLTRLFMAVFLCYFRRNLEKTLEEKKKDESAREISIQQMVEHYQQNKQKKRQDLQERIEHGSQNGNRSSSNECNQSSIAESSPKRQDSKVFWVLNKNLCFMQLLNIFYNSKVFYYFTLLGMLTHVVSIIFRSNADSQNKTKILNSIENISFAVYCIEVFIGVLCEGLYFQRSSYLKKSHFNKLSFFVVLLLIVSLIPFIDPLYQEIIRRLVIVKIFTVLKTRNKQMDIILKSIAQIIQNFLRILVIYILFLLMASILPLKLLKGSFYNCINPYQFPNQTNLSINNPVNCMNAGGDWVEDPQNFNNIFSSVLLMYQVVTSESWTYFIELSILQDIHWDIFFVAVFFFYNVCLLNIFVGLIIEKYIDLKDKAYKLNLLRPSQKGWILIKNCINELVPFPTIGVTTVRGFVQEICFKIITHKLYNNIIDLLAYLNIIFYAMTIYRSSDEYVQILLYLKVAMLLIFSVDTIIKLYALRKDYFYLDNSKVELGGFIYAIFYGFISLVKLTNQEERIVEFFLVVCLFLRCKKFLFRFTWSKTLINSVIEILPRCFQIGSFLFIVLFVYVAIGLEIFKHNKPTSKSDGYTTGFHNFYAGLMTLLKIASNQSWFDQVTVFLKGITPNDVCYQINSQLEAKLYSGMGCGSYIAIPFFISYHVLMALLVLGLLIATMTSAYDENYEKQYNSVNVFQLQDCLQLWKKYDPKGTGVIPYKKFWKLSSEIGILFGISKRKLIKSKQKFLQELDIPICQSLNPEDTSVLCYRFHDVITKFSKIKLQVSLDKGDQNSQSIEFDIHPMIENEIKDYIIKLPEDLYKNYRQFKDYTSGEMKYFFGLLRKLRSWKTRSKSKGQVKVSKLSRIIKVAMEKRIQEEHLKNLLVFCTGDQNDLLKKRSSCEKPNDLNSSIDKPNFNEDHENESNQSESELVDSEGMNHDQVIEKLSENYFDFNLNQNENEPQN